MGTNNQQRRAANKRRKQRAAANRQRTTASRPRPSTDQGRRAPPPPRRVPPGELLDAALDAWDVDRSRFDHLVRELLAHAASAVAVTDAYVQGSLEHLWSSGWTPADVIHVVDREQGTGHASVAAEQVVADGSRRRDGRQALHPRWRDQLAALRERQPTVPAPAAEERLHHLVEVLCLLVRLPEVPRTMPAPGGTWRGAAASEPHLDARMLAKVRALLAKAESTDFDDEAEALTAKAQELIARHAIDEALLHTVDDVGEPSVRRMLIDDPYAEAKSRLIARVADANRCRAVYSPGFSWSTVFGYDHDLDAVELLTASLLTQATSAMVRHGSRRDAAGRSRTRSFRRSFLLGFADRIGERLQQATDTQVSATADDGGQLVPVLAARDDQLLAAQRAAFPHLEHRATSVSNATGWHAGQVAAEVADLHAPRAHIA